MKKPLGTLVNDSKVEKKKKKKVDTKNQSVPRKARCHYIHDLATTFCYDIDWKSIVMRKRSSPPKKKKGERKEIEVFLPFFEQQ